MNNNTRQMTLLFGIVLIILASIGIGFLGVFNSFDTNTMLALSAATPIVPAVLLMLYLRKARKTKKEKSHAFRWAVGNLVIFSALLTIFFSYTSTKQTLDENTLLFVYQNLATAALGVTALFVVILFYSQNYRYWPLLNKVDKKVLDERELALRNRIYEESYGSLIIVSGILLYLFANIDSSHSRTILAWLTILSFFSLPAVIASKQKNS